jgi:hypothetical protein
VLCLAWEFKIKSLITVWVWLLGWLQTLEGIELWIK